MNVHGWPRWLIPLLCWTAAPFLAAAFGALVYWVAL